MNDVVREPICSYELALPLSYSARSDADARSKPRGE